MHIEDPVEEGATSNMKSKSIRLDPDTCANVNQGTHAESNSFGGTIEISETARNTLNPIRRLVDRLKITPPKHLEMISLSIGTYTFCFLF